MSLADALVVHKVIISLHGKVKGGECCDTAAGPTVRGNFTDSVKQS